jgi:hypothetical protein
MDLRILPSDQEWVRGRMMFVKMELVEMWVSGDICGKKRHTFQIGWQEHKHQQNK